MSGELNDHVHTAGASGRRPVRPARHRAPRALVGGLGLLVALTAGACGGSGSGTTGTVVPVQTAPPATGVPATAPVRLPCNPVALATAAATAHPEASVTDESCDATFAVATVNAPDLGGEQVAFFRVDAGAWKLLGVAPITDDVAGAAPGDVPAALIRTWRFRFDSARTPTTTRPPVTDPAAGNQDGLIETVRTTTTTLPPTTTTTTTTPPPTEPTASPFCQLNPAFPDCRTDPFYPGP